MAGLTGWQLVILVAMVVLLFGAQQLPGMARAVGQSPRIFKGDMKDTAPDEHTRSPQRAPAAHRPANNHPSPSRPVATGERPPIDTDAT